MNQANTDNPMAGARRVRGPLLDIRALVEELRERRSRVCDVYVPFDKLEAAASPRPAPPQGWPEGARTTELRLRITDGFVGSDFAVEHVLDQLSMRLGQSHQIPPARYLHELLGVGDDGVAAARDNVEFWLRRRDGAEHRDGSRQRDLVRLLADRPVMEPDGKTNQQALFEARLRARAILSDRYLVVDDLSLLTTAIQVAAGKFDFSAAVKDGVYGGENYANGAVAFEKRLTEDHFDLILANPTLTFDLNRPEDGVRRLPSLPTLDTRMGEGHEFLKAGPRDDGSLPLFPACRITNSETGRGGYAVHGGLYEAVCRNAAFVGGRDLIKRHAAGVLNESEESIAVREARTRLVFAEIADALRLVFDPEVFERYCRQMVGLAGEAVSEVKPALEAALRHKGLSDVLIDDLVNAYHSQRAVAGRVAQPNSVLDVQRAVTAVAQSDILDRHIVMALEDLGGDLLERGGKILAGAGK